ncbi:MAG: DUF427 domain-containing protein [Pseudomonadota bacterium]
MPERTSLYHKYPDYRVDLEPNPERVCVKFQGHVVADTDQTLLIKETKHAPVIYFPRDAINFDLLQRTEHQTFCPFKGDASYWSLATNSATEENAVWSYEDPFEEVLGLKDYVAFYEDKVEWA